ncbi:protein of unknown function [Modestobacter italicus]|uniref:Nudix hydrolase domain-containing protein n=1 Tax=Modestobacter italicus (strain DSM 44449 / CECT 9708 / BC 501) TaxID=2732864 RepID=I4F1K2_MODI5|nr:hypothetical protein [Modestobacter marinus]CCH89515.1 protein of unknown function [Modestobacter marinus]
MSLTALALPDVLTTVGGQAFSLVAGAAVGVFAGARYQEPLQRASERRRRLRYAKRITQQQQSGVGRGVSVAGLETRVHIVEGDGRLLLEPANVQIRLEQQPVELSAFVRDARARVLDAMAAPTADAGVEAAWNSETLVSLLGYRITRTGAREDSQLLLSACPTDYATFTATVTGLDDDIEVTGPDGALTTTSVRQQYLYDEAVTAEAIDRPVPELANGLGVALLVFTDDDKVILARRRTTARARPGERDVSVVEGMHTEHDRSSADALDVVSAAVRGCEEELGIQVGRRDVKILALGVDMTYYQWSFLGLVNAHRGAGPRPARAARAGPVGGPPRGGAGRPAGGVRTLQAGRRLGPGTGDRLPRPLPPGRRRSRPPGRRGGLRPAAPDVPAPPPAEPGRLEAPRLSHAEHPPKARFRWVRLSRRRRGTRTRRPCSRTVP